MSFDPRGVLAASGDKEDSGLDVLTLALAFAADAHQGISIDRYFSHMKKAAQDIAARHKELIDAGAGDDAGARLAALKHILHDREGYRGDTESYDDLQNADLMRVIDRRKGLPVALCILYIHTGRANGWSVEGVNFPGHFLARIEYNGERLIFDPFDGCAVMEAPELRQLIKRVHGDKAELSADYYKPCTNREILIRLQNNIKLRAIDGEDYALALRSVEMMRLLDPNEYRLLLDAGVLYAKTGQPEKAADVLEKYIEKTPSAQDRRDAEAILRTIHETAH